MITWVDIETTGLDPNQDDILEVAVLVTTDDFELVIGQVWIEPLPEDYTIKNPFVSQMHEDSGLMRDCKRAHTNLKEQAFLAIDKEAIGAWIGENTVASPMGGSSVHFDRMFLTHHFGLEWMSKHFSHRCIDVSTLKELAKRHAPHVAEEWEQLSEANGPKKHRAMSDLSSTIQEAKFYTHAMRYGQWKK